MDSHRGSPRSSLPQPFHQPSFLSRPPARRRGKLHEVGRNIAAPQSARAAKGRPRRPETPLSRSSSAEPDLAKGGEVSSVNGELHKKLEKQSGVWQRLAQGFPLRRLGTAALDVIRDESATTHN